MSGTVADLTINHFKIFECQRVNGQKIIDISSNLVNITLLVPNLMILENICSLALNWALKKDQYCNGFLRHLF